MLTRAHGQMTEENVERVGKLSGPMGSLLDKVFAENLGETYVTRSKTPAGEKQENVIKQMVACYKDDKLVRYEGQRHHPTYGKTLPPVKTEVKKPEKFKHWLLNHVKKIDQMTYALPDFDDADPEPENQAIIECDTASEEESDYDA